MSTTAPHYRDVTVRDLCRIMVLCGGQTISLKLHVVMMSQPLSAIRQLATSTVTVGLVVMLGSALIEIMSIEGRHLMVIVIRPIDGRLVQLPVASESQDVVVVSHRDLAVTARAVVAGVAADRAGQDRVAQRASRGRVVDDRATRRHGRVAAAGQDLATTDRATSLVRRSNDVAVDTRGTTTDDVDDGIPRQVAVVQAAGLPW